MHHFSELIDRVVLSSSSSRKPLISVKPNVICDDSAMTVEMDKSSLGGLVAHLQLNDPSNVACSLQRQQNSTHIIAVVPLSGCGTQIEVNKSFRDASGSHLFFPYFAVLSCIF